MIADRRTATPEDIASSDEMITLVQFALDGASRADRESFILHAIEGFSVEEIAAITDRKPEEVRASIESAREHLRRSALLASRFRERVTAWFKPAKRLKAATALRRNRNDYPRRYP